MELVYTCVHDNIENLLFCFKSTLAFIGGCLYEERPNTTHRKSFPNFETGLNIVLGKVKEIFEWSDCYFAKMVLPLGDHLVKGQLVHFYTF